MARKRRKKGLRTLDQMDVTPLVDLTFILLIVFMLTAPALENSIDVSPPAMKASDIEKNDKNKIVEVTKEGKIIFEGETLTLERLQAKAISLNQSDSDLFFYIRADSSRSYGEVIKVLDTLRKAGVTNYNLVTTAE